VTKVLIHSCCAHCTAYTATYWKEQGYEVVAYWYNPNIHPPSEYEKRFIALKKLCREQDITLLVEEYDYGKYFNAIGSCEENRCFLCFKLRLDKTARTARQKKYNGFGTTLLISPHQEHELLKEAGQIAAEREGIQFCYTDLRKRYSESRRMTKPYQLYCQRYCGCVYSMWESWFTAQKQACR
jgi:predicted adenine nucleotide alpha hydrolase (AANH) superfamily ATPase